MIQDGKLRGFAMGHAIPVRTDYTAGEVRQFAQRAKDAAQARRLLAIAAVLEGASLDRSDRALLYDSAEKGPMGGVELGRHPRRRDIDETVWRKSARSSHPTQR